MPQKTVTGRIWSSVLSKLALAGLVYTLFYVIGDSLHIIPQSLKDLMSFLASSLSLSLFCADLPEILLWKDRRRLKAHRKQKTS